MSKSIALGALSIVAFLVLWTIAHSLRLVPPYILPGLSAVLKSVVVERSLLVTHGLCTLLEAVVGFAVAFAVGVALALAFHYSETVKMLLYPLVVGLQAFPKESLAPLFLLWFGYGLTSKVVIAVLIAIFPIIVNTKRGLEQTPLNISEEIRVWTTSEWFMFKEVKVWYALPYVLSAVKISITFSFIGAVVGEFIGSDRGLGHLINVARSQMNLELLFACIIVLFLMSTAVFLLVGLVESRIMKGKFQEVT